MAAVAAAGLAVGLTGVAGEPARADGTTLTATTYSTAGTLDGVAAASNSNAWAVGSTGLNSSQRILMLHWNGSSWSRVTKPSVLAAPGGLSAVTVVNSRDAWAVGSTLSGASTTHTLLLHWNGSAWSQVTSPAPVKNGVLSAVAATASGGWAVGYISASAAANFQALIFRLSGSKWSRFGTKLGLGAGLGGVAITSGRAAWAIGSEAGMITANLAKWNGSTWSPAGPFPLEGVYHGLYGIAAGPGGIVFVVGWNGNAPPTPALSMKWTGKAWVKVTVGAPVSSGLNAVTFAPGGTAWAAGQTGTRTMILRWNGQEWTRIASPGSGGIYGLGFSAAGYGWAVGVAPTPSGTGKTLILHWNGHSWN